MRHNLVMDRSLSLKLHWPNQTFWAWSLALCPLARILELLWGPPPRRYLQHWCFFWLLSTSASPGAQEGIAWSICAKKGLSCTGPVSSGVSHESRLDEKFLEEEPAESLVVAADLEWEARGHVEALPSAGPRLHCDFNTSWNWTVSSVKSFLLLVSLKWGFIRPFVFIMTEHTEALVKLRFTDEDYLKTKCNLRDGSVQVKGCASTQTPEPTWISTLSSQEVTS